MNRTVRDVGGLILSIILMISLYGVYKGGTANTGHLVFGHMTRDVGKALGGLNKLPVQSWNLKPNSTFDPQTPKNFMHNIPDKAWKKGVTIKGINGRTEVIKKNSDGKWFDQTEGESNLLPDVTVQHGIAGVSPDDPRTNWAESPQNSKFDPNNNTLTLSNWQPSTDTEPGNRY